MANKGAIKECMSLSERLPSIFVPLDGFVCIGGEHYLGEYAPKDKGTGKSIVKSFK